jgi:uncharacterized protein (DUF2237 family)
MPMLALTKVKAHVVSEDGGHVAVAFATQEGNDLSVMMPIDCLDVLISGLNRARSAAKNKKAEDANQINVTVPKTWMVTAELKINEVVLVVFDPKTDTQAGYALDVVSAKKMAAGLIQNANAIETHRATKKELR